MNFHRPGGGACAARSPWTDERIDALKTLWGRGLTARQCAVELGGGITRNAVIGKAQGHDLTHAWAGNVVDLCPVGALLSKDFLNKARAWELDRTASVCPNCSQGRAIKLQACGADDVLPLKNLYVANNTARDFGGKRQSTLTEDGSGLDLICGIQESTFFENRIDGSTSAAQYGLQLRNGFPPSLPFSPKFVTQNNTFTRNYFRSGFGGPGCIGGFTCSLLLRGGRVRRLVLRQPGRAVSTVLRVRLGARRGYGCSPDERRDCQQSTHGAAALPRALRLKLGTRIAFHFRTGPWGYRHTRSSAGGG